MLHTIAGVSAHSLNSRSRPAEHPKHGDTVVTATTPLAAIRIAARQADVVADGAELWVHVRNGVDEILRVRAGIQVAGRDLAADSVFVRAASREVVENLTPRTGKRTLATSTTHQELTVVLRDSKNLEWHLIVRLAEDGVALRYSIPDLQGVSTLDGERTSLATDSFDRAWVLDYQTWYETPRFGADLTELETGDYGFPVLLRANGDRYTLVTESSIDGRSSGSHGHFASAENALQFVAADTSVEIARGPITPWRVFIIGTLPAVVESSFVDELAPPQHQAVGDAQWVRPGRAAWSWWSDFYSGAQLEDQKHFVDVAAQLGWEHLLIDCGWEETWVPEIVSYASRYGIQVHLWTVWHDLDGPEKLERLALWRSWGVAGIKVDFMESESKDRYRWYDTILQETARLGMMVNFHGSVIPRGWSRTWPQVIGYEAIRGSEYYVFYNDTPLTAYHNVIQPFTRNIVGGMDYTPVAFTAPGRTTSDGHELALSVAFECGITHFADGVDAYLARPHAAAFLAQLAPSWDETLLLGGDPDTEAVIARRSGKRWFIGAIATGPARTIDVPLARLGDGPFNAWVVGDAPNSESRGLSETRIPAAQSLSVPVSENGGFVAVVAPLGTELLREIHLEEAPLPTVGVAVVELDDAGLSTICAPNATNVRVAPGWAATPLTEGQWKIHAPADLPPGGVGIVTIESVGVRGVPATSPIRVVRPLNGTVPLSSLPMLAFQNESGPVERDMSNGGGNPKDGGRMTVADQEYESGIGMSSPGEARFHLGGHAVRLVGSVAVDDETPDSSARAVIEADGEVLTEISVSSGHAPVAFDLDLTGRRALALRTESRSATPAHVDWIAPELNTSRMHTQQPGQ